MNTAEEFVNLYNNFDHRGKDLMYRFFKAITEGADFPIINGEYEPIKTFEVIEKALNEWE